MDDDFSGAFDMAQIASPPVRLDIFRTSNFAPAFYFLRRDQRRALAGVYAFCRLVDDAVDQAAKPAQARTVLERWRGYLETFPAHPSDTPLEKELAWALTNFSVPRAALLDLLDGVARDLVPFRCRTLEELQTYCYGVASTVGLACLPIFGLKEEEHRDFAVTLGWAVQLTNILRDAGPDGHRGRLYLPAEDLARFGVGEKEFMAGARGEKELKLLMFEADRAREFYRRAWEALPVSSRTAARPALAMGRLYERLLDKVEQQGFPAKGPRVELGMLDKTGVLWNVWRGGPTLTPR
jgi:phytoene synthase